MKTDSPIQVRDLSKAFQKPVLEGVTLEVQAGEIVSILGRSGTGKSVLLKLVIGLERPDAGSIVLEGQEMTTATSEQTREVRKKVGFLFQQAALYDSMTISENVEFPLLRQLALPPGERQGKAKELLAKVGLDSGIDKMPGELSGGMKKRVGLARALALDPEILMLDEPTAGLDPTTSAEIVELIANIRRERNATCLLVTHDLHSARKISDRFVALNEGKVVAAGTFEDLRTSRDPFLVKFLKDAE